MWHWLKPRQKLPLLPFYFSCGEKKNRKKSTRKSTVQSIQVNSCKRVEMLNGTRNRCENLRAIVPPRAAERDEEDRRHFFYGQNREKSNYTTTDVCTKEENFSGIHAYKISIRAAYLDKSIHFTNRKPNFPFPTIRNPGPDLPRTQIVTSHVEVPEESGTTTYRLRLFCLLELAPSTWHLEALRGFCVVVANGAADERTY